MLNQDEILFVVDKENNPIDPLPRSVVHEKGLWHRTAHIWVINKQKEILCQQRSILKDISPGNWDPYFGGHLQAHISYEDGALEELKEESGIHASKDELQFYKIDKNEKLHEFQGIFVYVWDGNIELLSYEKDEVEKVEWFPLKEVKEFILGEMEGWSKVPYGKKLLEKIGDI